VGSNASVTAVSLWATGGTSPAESMPVAKRKSLDKYMA
jgi:hypothetical protein